MARPDQDFRGPFLARAEKFWPKLIPKFSPGGIAPEKVLHFYIGQNYVKLTHLAVNQNDRLQCKLAKNDLFHKKRKEYHPGNY